MSAISIPGLPLAASPLCLGGVPFGAPLDQEQTYALLDRYVALGGNFIDTARMYSDWIPGERSRSERVLGDWLQARRLRERLVIATKGMHPELETPTIPRSSAVEIRTDLEGSLRSLRVDTIDLYWLHRDDPAKPASYFVDLLNEFIRAGKIRAYGFSNWGADRLRAAHDHARATGQVPLAASQPYWCLGHLQAKPTPFHGLAKLDAAAHAFHATTGTAVIPYTAQAKGYFSKALLPAVQRPANLADHEFDTEPNRALAQLVGEIARARGTSVNAIVLGYLWSRPFPVVPIIGASHPAQLDDNFAAIGCQLRADEMRALEAAANSGLASFG